MTPKKPIPWFGYVGGIVLFTTLVEFFSGIWAWALPSSLTIAMVAGYGLFRLADWSIPKEDRIKEFWVLAVPVLMLKVAAIFLLFQPGVVDVLVPSAGLFVNGLACLGILLCLVLGHPTLGGLNQATKFSTLPRRVIFLGYFLIFFSFFATGVIFVFYSEFLMFTAFAISLFLFDFSVFLYKFRRNPQSTTLFYVTLLFVLLRGVAFVSVFHMNGSDLPASIPLIFRALGSMGVTMIVLVTPVTTPWTHPIWRALSRKETPQQAEAGSLS